MIDERATAKATGQRECILALLRKRGPAGAMNSELNLVAFRYSSRIWELRGVGHQIITVNEGDGIFHFVLDAEPADAQSETVEAFDQGPNAQPGQRPAQGLGPPAQAALLDLAVSLTMNKTAYPGRLGPLGDAIDVVLDGLHNELMRRWEKRAGPPIAIEFPDLTPAVRAEVTAGFTTFENLFRRRVSSDDTLAKPFLEESLRVAQAVLLAVARTSELRN